MSSILPIIKLTSQQYIAVILFTIVFITFVIASIRHLKDSMMGRIIIIIVSAVYIILLIIVTSYSIVLNG